MHNIRVYFEEQKAYILSRRLPSSRETEPPPTESTDKAVHTSDSANQIIRSADYWSWIIAKTSSPAVPYYGLPLAVKT